MTKRVYFVVHGTVQGMCRLPSRYFTRKKAREYGVTGWCRNTRDDTVEGEAQATEDILTKFLKDVDYGPRHARVTKVVKEDREIVEGEDSFDVTR
ncbi:Acylphosphatase-like domain-containing protein [Fusarium keratoplasticum]|uniref:Acylphosphatase-like domain-containing protein n=1 Tax=Fusarium keratoplasticum TaxID=1328300 RepID=A0ACC0RGB6_9HYPO|nr:Acylphosphatase-like domain-containing protein [Fusarium keratoplasticum]KAI8684383.1 Acylphosphatase-like domain-containing protein [Fusarium keratoplasticum]